MIVQIDHLAYASNDFEGDTAFFTALGYSVSFTEMQAPNPTNKRGLLSDYQPEHDLRLLKKEGSFPVELLNHNTSSGKTGFLRPCSSSLPANLHSHSAAGFLHPDENEGSPDGISHVLIHSSNPGASAEFWRQLGFKQNRANLEFSSPLQKARLSLAIIQADPLDSPFQLDDLGFNCLALVSTSAAKERERLSLLGYRVSELEPFTVHNQKFVLFFVIGPGGELVEILGLDRG